MSRSGSGRKKIPASFNYFFPRSTSLEPFLLSIAAWTAFLTFLMGLPLLVMRVKFPMQVGQGEAINVEFALTFLRGGHLYGDPAHAPYLYTAYPPLFPWLQSCLMPLFRNPWIPGRALAFAGYLGCTLLMFFWGKDRWGWPRALLLGSVLGCYQTWALWGTMVRGDAVSLFLCFAAFLLLYRVERSRGKEDEGLGSIVLAGFLSFLSILVKQDAIELPLVYGLYCVLGKRWKKLGSFLATCLVPLALFVGWQQEVSGGFFLKYVLQWLDTGVQWANFWYYLKHFALREGGVLFFILILLSVAKRTEWFLQLQVAVSFLALLGLARSMSAENYLMGFLLFGTFATGEYLSATDRPWMVRLQKLWGLRRVSLAWILLLVLLWAATLTMRWPNLPQAGEINMKFNAMQEFKKPGDPLALDLDLLVMAGKPIWLQPAEYKAMVEKGTWSPDPLLKDIRSKRFSTIELYDLPEQYLLPKVVTDEILRNYRPFLHRYGRVWLTPNPS